MRAALIVVALALLALAAAPAARAETILGVSANNIFSFESESPDVVERLTRVTGMPDGFFLGAVDFRPATGELYGVADQAASLKALFKIDLASGQATQVGEKFMMAGQRTALSMAFNPATGMIRVASGAQKMVRADPDTGVVLPLTDTSKPLGALAYSGGTLYGFVTRDIPEKRGLYLVDQVNGTVAPRVGAEFPFNTPIQEDYAGLDFSGGSGLGYLSFITSGGAVQVYALNLSNGMRTPLGATLLDLSSLAVVPARPVELSASFVSVDENAGSATLTVQRAPGSWGPARVNYATFDGSATGGSDYTPTSGTLALAANQNSASFTVPIAADTADERGETFGVRLSRPVGGFLGERTQASVTIVDPPVSSGGGTGGGGTGGGGTGGGGTGGGGTGGGGTGGGGTVTPPDTAAPILLLAPRERSSMRRPIAVRYSCSEACTTTLELIVDSKTQKRLRLKSRTLGTATATLTAAGKGTASVKVTRAALKRLKRARRVKAKLRASAADAAGNRTAETAKLLLVR